MEKDKLILDSALKLFSKHGFMETSIDKIAKDAGVAKGSVYTYFTSKDDLLKAILVDGVEAIKEGIKEEIVSEEDFKELISTVINTLIKRKEFWRLYYSVIFQPAIAELFKDVFSAFIEEYISTIVGYYERKGVENPLATAMLLGSTLDGISLGYIMSEDFYPIEIIEKEIIEKFK